MSNVENFLRSIYRGTVALNLTNRHNWGMGLYYVKTIAQGHFGNVRIESVEGEGTSLFILLPKYSSRG